MSAFGSPPPPNELKDFPSYTLTPVTPLFRAHKAEREPWWFCSCKQCRFDLAQPLGTCYFARTAIGAYVERFRGFTYIRQQVLDNTRMSRVHVPSELLLADCTASRALAFGVTGEVHSSRERLLTQEWAAAFHQVGFAGVRYLARTDPAQRRMAIALFSDAGVAHWDVVYTRRIDRRIINQAARSFGIRIINM